MHIYKFRILLEDNEQFFREIDIKANQTFEEFHKAIAASAEFDLSEMASFYICDSKWNKQQELTLCDLSTAEDNIIDEEEDDEDNVKKKPVMPVAMMCKTRMKDAINDPHQHIIYIYDFLKMYTFYIELFKIREAEEGVVYPKLVKSTGNIPKAPTPIAPGDEDLDEDDMDDITGEEEPSPEDDSLDGLYDDNSFN